MLDLKIVNGLLLDGTGAPAVRADVGVRGDTIAAVEDLSAAEARRTIDAAAPAPGGAEPRRRIVCPGFIDAHSHSDVYALVEPSAAGKIRQGVTTEVVGNCGVSAAPRTGAWRMPSDWADKPLPGAWGSMADYRALVDRVRPAVNLVTLVGHGNLRGAVIGYANRPATADELAAMARLLEESLDAGAHGLSTGLIYPPGMFAPREELVALARVAARRGGLYSSHMRSEAGRLLEAIEEALAIGRESGARVQISHLKTSRPANWDKLDQALNAIRAAREAGPGVAADRYPYTASNTGLDSVLPTWAQEGGNDAELARLRDPAARARLRGDLLRALGSGDWDGIIVAATYHPDLARFRGRPLVQAAAALGLEPVDALLHILDVDDVRTSAFFSWMNEANMLRILAEPYVMIGSDASIHLPDGPLGTEFVHPRSYGTFPRFLRLALDGRTVPLPEAVRKMTALPAAQFGLADRGTVAPGRKADLVVFDPPRVRDAATYAEPHRFAEGIDHVVVNGAWSLRDGACADERGGRFL